MKTLLFSAGFALSLTVLSSLCSINFAQSQPILFTGNASQRPHSLQSKPTNYQAAIKIAAQRFDIPASWISAIITIESGWNARAVSSAGAIGLMQVMPMTYDEMRLQYGLGSDPFDPRDNILSGTAYLQLMHQKYGRNGFLAAYNVGPDRYEKHLASGNLLPIETRRYIAKLEPVLTDQSGQISVLKASFTASLWASSPLFVASKNQPVKPHIPAAQNRSSSKQNTSVPDDILQAITPRSTGLFAVSKEETG